MTDKWALLFIISGLVLFAVGRQFQRSLDLWRKWKGALAAIPGMEKAAKGGVWTFIKWGAIGLLVVWAAARINTYV